MDVWMCILIDPVMGGVMVEGVFPSAADAQAFAQANPQYAPRTRQIIQAHLPFAQPKT